MTNDAGQADLSAPNFATIADLSPHLADGLLSAEALLAECLAAIDANDRRGAALSAIICLNPMAQAEAQELDRERVRQGVRGPLHGVPMVLKDNIDMAGLATTSGNCAMAGAVALKDAEQTLRLRQAGAVIVAKTNMSEFSFEIRSRSSIGGDVLNPFNRNVTAGGSSGGTAAAISAGFAVAGLGSDTGGSIRTPAAYTGLVGLRPTKGLLDCRGVAPLAPTTDTVAPMGRTVGDVARLMAVMSDASHASRFANLQDANPRLASARIGVLRQAFGVDSEIYAAMDAALEVMAQAGAIVVPVMLADELIPHGRDHVVDWEFRSAWDAYLASSFTAGTVPASLAAICASGTYLPDHQEALTRRAAVQTLDEPQYRAILQRHRDLRDALTTLMDEHRLDAIVYPTSAVTPQSLDNPRGGWAPELAACSGWPALSLPMGQASNRVPIGLELLGRAFDDASLLSLGSDLERRLGRRYRPLL